MGNYEDKKRERERKKWGEILRIERLNTKIFEEEKNEVSVQMLSYYEKPFLILEVFLTILEFSTSLKTNIK